jgi:hypothetical protein
MKVSIYCEVERRDVAMPSLQDIAPFCQVSHLRLKTISTEGLPTLKYICDSRTNGSLNQCTTAMTILLRLIWASHAEQRITLSEYSHWNGVAQEASQATPQGFCSGPDH